MQQNSSRPPENNLVWAILATVLCCLPFGIVAILKASKVDQLWYQGRYEEAQKAADDAKKWAIYSAASVAILIFLYFAFTIVIILLSSVANA